MDTYSNIVYTIILDKNSIKNILNTKRIIYKGNSVTSKIYLAFRKDITKLLIIFIGEESEKDIRKEIISIFENDTYLKDALSRAWINIHTVPKDISRFFIRTFNILFTSLSRNDSIILDISYILNVSYKYNLFDISYVLSKIKDIKSTLVDGFFIGKSTLYLHDVRLSYPEIETSIDLLLYFLDLLISLVENDRLSSHVLKMIQDKLSEFKNYLDMDLMFHALNIFRSLYDFLSGSLQNLRDKDLRFLLENVFQSTLHVEKFDNVYSCVKCFIRYLSSFDKYLLSLSKFFIVYIVLKLLSECVYYGSLDNRIIDLDYVDRILSNYNILHKLVNLFNRSDLKSLLNYVHIRDICGIARVYCRAVYHRDFNEFGNVYCRGKFNLDEIRRLLLSCLDLVDQSCYELCDRVRDCLRIML